MTTARDIIQRAMLKIGALAQGEVASVDATNDALDSLNSMIDSWANDSLIIYARTWESFTLTGGTSTYTIGSGGTFNTVRPIDIVDAYLRNGTVDYPMGIITDEAYNGIPYKSIQGIPDSLNYDNAYPLGNIRLYPVPPASYSLFLLTEKPITTFTSLDTVMSLPVGWLRALIYNLAIEISPEYSQDTGQTVDASVVKIANDSLNLIRTSVAKVRTMDAYPQIVTTRNIFTGWRN